MASKRGAGSELTDRNWDQEEDPEEAGSFKQAEDSALKQRVIKTAKRRGTSLGAGSSGAFTGFGGFASSSSAAAAASKPNVSFSFGGLAPSTTASKADASSDEDKPAVNFSFGSLASGGPTSTTTDQVSTKPKVNFSFGNVSAAAASSSSSSSSSSADAVAAEETLASSSSSSSSAGNLNGSKPHDGVEAASSSTEARGKKTASADPSVAAATTTTTTTTAAAAADGKSTSTTTTTSADKAKTERKYLAHVKTLNKSVLAWIQKHVEDRPTCILTPVFEDYEKHLKRIEERFGVVQSDNDDDDDDSEPEAGGANMAAAMTDEKPAANGSTAPSSTSASDEGGSSAASGTATTNGVYASDHSSDTYSATKTRFTCTTPSQSAARGLDASLKEIDSKDRAKKDGDEPAEGGEDKPKLSHFASFSAIKTNHTFSFSNLSHARAPTSSCNSSMKPTFSFCVSSSGEKPSETFTTSTTAAAAAASASASSSTPMSSAENNAGLFSFGSGGGGIFSSSSSSSTPAASAAASSASETNKGVFSNTPPTFSFGGGVAASSSSTAPTFSFGSGSGGMFGTSSSSSGGGGGGIFGGGGTFSFASSTSSTGAFGGFGASVAAAASQSNGAKEGGGGDDDDYVPPKPEVQEISEDDAIFTKRCKLFYKKDDAFVDRGVGNLFIKPLPSDDGEDSKKKYSLLVRADTNLGNILLNISLNSLKFNKMGAKDVSFLCVPNPLPDPKMPADAPVIMLLRVKDSPIRDELIEQLNSHV